MELQQALPDLESAGVAVFGLSYDAPAVLAEFADKRGITFPLLSDEGSHAIRALGLLNQHVAEQHAFYGVAVRDEHHGVPYPGTFVLDEHGVVTARYFEQSYRMRPTAALFREFALRPMRRRGGTRADHDEARDRERAQRREDASSSSVHAATAKTHPACERFSDLPAGGSRTADH